MRRLVRSHQPRRLPGGSAALQGDPLQASFEIGSVKLCQCRPPYASRRLGHPRRDLAGFGHALRRRRELAPFFGQ
jgi:hypothetical protein